MDAVEVSKSKERGERSISALGVNRASPYRQGRPPKCRAGGCGAFQGDSRMGWAHEGAREVSIMGLGGGRSPLTAHRGGAGRRGLEWDAGMAEGWEGSLGGCRSDEK